MLRQNNLSFSFQFYNPLIAILNETITDQNIKYQFNIQKLINTVNISKKSLKMSLHQLGSIDKLYKKSDDFLKEFPKNIDVFESQHVNSLQVSKCMAVKYQCKHIEKEIFTSQGKKQDDKAMIDNLDF